MPCNGAGGRTRFTHRSSPPVSRSTSHNFPVFKFSRSLQTPHPPPKKRSRLFSPRLEIKTTLFLRFSNPSLHDLHIGSASFFKTTQHVMILRLGGRHPTSLVHRDQAHRVKPSSMKPCELSDFGGNLPLKLGRRCFVDGAGGLHLGTIQLHDSHPMLICMLPRSHVCFNVLHIIELARRPMISIDFWSRIRRCNQTSWSSTNFICSRPLAR